MRSTLWQAVMAASLVTLGVAGRAGAAVSLVFTNVGASTSVATVAPGGTFNFSVQVAESLATDQVTGVDYQIKSSTSGVVEFLSRNSSAGQFSSSNGFSDGYLNSNSYSPHVLNPGNGTDLGTSLSNPSASVSGPGTFDTADFSFKVLPGTPLGVYTLSFTNADYVGAPPSYPTVGLTPSSSFTVVVGTSVPEPATGTLLLLTGTLLMARRRAR